MSSHPFGHSIIIDLVRNQWFGKGKVDIRAYNKMMVLKEIPDEVIILVVTVVSDMCFILGKTMSLL